MFSAKSGRPTTSKTSIPMPKYFPSVPLACGNRSWRTPRSAPSGDESSEGTEFTPSWVEHSTAAKLDFLIPVQYRGSN